MYVPLDKTQSIIYNRRKSHIYVMFQKVQIVNVKPGRGFSYVVYYDNNDGKVSNFILLLDLSVSTILLYIYLLLRLTNIFLER